MIGRAWDKLIADARDEALEEAAVLLDGQADEAHELAKAFFASQHMTASDQCSGQFTALRKAARAIRSLKSKPEQENHDKHTYVRA